MKLRCERNLMIALWAGIAANFVFGVGALFYPQGLLTGIGLPSTPELIWLRNAGMLLILLSVSYMPAADDPWRDPLGARRAVAFRVIAAAFWWWQILSLGAAPGFLLLASLDTLLAAVQAVLLVKLILRG